MLAKAVKSALNQTHTNVEVIVIDDSSNEHTKQSLSKFNLPIKYIKNSKSKGAQFSRNVGLSESNGDFIAFLDDDDYWLPQKIEKQLDYIEEFPIISCNSFSLLPKGNKLYTKRPNTIRYQELLHSNLIGSCSFPLINSKAAKDIYFDESLKSCQDWDYWIALLRSNNISEIKSLSDYLVYYNIDSHPRISSINNDLQAIRNLVIHQKYLNEYDDLQSLINIIIAEFCISNESNFLHFIGLMYKAKLRKHTISMISTVIRNKLFSDKYHNIY